MENLIESKLNELISLGIDLPGFRSWLNESSMWNWVYSYFKITGQLVSKAAVVDLCNGVIREDIPLSNYGFVQSFKALYIDMQSDLSMQTLPDLKVFTRWMDIVTGEMPFRTSNPVVYDYGLIPCHFNDIKSEIAEAFRCCFCSRDFPVVSAAKLFLDIVRIYPYDEHSVDAAMAVLLYCFMRLGLPFPEFSVNEEEFGNLVRAYMDKKNSVPFTDMLCRCVYNRLDSVCVIARKLKDRLAEDTDLENK